MREPEQQFTIGLDDLSVHLMEVEDAYPDLKPDRRFVMWFVKAYGSGGFDQAEDSLPGPNREKGLDAVYIDTNYKRVMLVQGKYRTANKPKPEGWPDIIELLDAARVLASPNQAAFRAFCTGIDPRVSALLKTARKKLRTGEYDLDICFATTGSISRDHVKRAEMRAGSIQVEGGRTARFVPYTRAEILHLVEREMDGSTPPVPPIVLPITSKTKMEHMESLGTARESQLTMWVFSVNGRELARRVRPYKLRIFNANVRGFLGISDKGIGRDILTTIEQRPHHFVLVNNGITMLATKAKPDREAGKEVMVVHEPQIVNGQQTTRVLEAAADLAKNVAVVVRVIEVPAGVLNEPAGEESLVGRIVKATNRQNRVSAADLKSNHPTQVWLERELEQLGYRYLRKRESREETNAGPRARKQLKKGALARAVATCISDTWGLTGEEPRFDKNYDAIFRWKDPWYYALCFVLFERVSTLARGSSEKTWARYAVTRFIWKRSNVQLRASRKAVVSALQRTGRAPEIDRALNAVIDIVLKEAVVYYRSEGRAKSGEREDVQKFFKKKNAYAGFERWWRSQRNTRRARFNEALKELKRVLKATSD